MRASLLPATPLSVATLAPQTGSFASPPHDGYALCSGGSRTWQKTYFNVSPAADTGETREPWNKVNGCRGSQIARDVMQSLLFT